MSMDFRLVHSDWGAVLDEALRLGHPRLRIVCPFIKKRVAERLLKQGKAPHIQVITRFNLCDFCEGVSDIAALRFLMQNEAKIRGVRNLHAKLYLFGESRAIVTSANLTDAALQRNQEFGFVAEDTKIIDSCANFFENLWGQAGPDLSFERLMEWEEKVNAHLMGGSRPSGRTGLGDEGVDVGNTVPSIVPPGWVAEASQAFVKFFGVSSDRAERSVTVLEEVERTGCHWACTYPKGKRPRQPQDGAVIFMGRLVKEPNDILIYGRGVAMRYQEGRDDASHIDIELRPWKEKWPHYIRVHHAEFVAGTLGDGVSLSELMDELKSDAFASTKRNAAKGSGNTDPRRAYMEQAAVELSDEGYEWVNNRLEAGFLNHGKLASAELEQLDWPDLPVPSTHGTSR
jgi:hypothetical protein